MKKVLMYIIFISIILILSKFYLSNYKIEYSINNYKIKEVYNDSRYYFEITNDKTYNFDIYKKRTLILCPFLIFLFNHLSYVK